jgi:DNA-binding Lrp family transcriptional regulator
MLKRFDSIERAIISLINCGADEALDSISRRLRTTKSKVFRSVRKAERLSVLGFTQPFIDYSLLGLTSFWIPLGFGCRGPAVMQTLLSRIERTTSITSAYLIGGTYQLLLVMTLRSPALIGAEVDRLLERADLSNVEYSVLTQIRSTFYGRRYLAGRLKLGHPCDTSALREKISLSQTEERLLVAMLQRETTNASELGRALGVSASTSIRCLRSLEERGVIKGYIRDLNTAALGLLRYSLFIRAAGSTSTLITNLQGFLLKEESVVSVTEFIGSWHLEIQCEVTRPEEVSALTQRLYHAAGASVRALELVPILTTVKFRTFSGIGE